MKFLKESPRNRSNLPVIPSLLSPKFCLLANHSLFLRCLLVSRVALAAGAFALLYFSATSAKLLLKFSVLFGAARNDLFFASAASAVILDDAKRDEVEVPA